MQDMQKKFMECRGAGQTRTHVLLWKEYVGSHVKQNVVDLSHVKQGEVQTSHDDMFKSDIVTIVVFGHELTHPPLYRNVPSSHLLHAVAELQLLQGATQFSQTLRDGYVPSGHTE